MGAEQLAGDLAVLRLAAAPWGRGAAAATLPAMVEGREEGEVMLSGIVRGEVGGEEEKARDGGEE